MGSNSFMSLSITSINTTSMNTTDACFLLSSTQISQIKAFHAYCMYNAAAYCAICLNKLYPDQVMVWPTSQENIHFPCSDWGYPPLRQWPLNWVQTDQIYDGHVTDHVFDGVIVCSNCEKNASPPFSALKYPGNEKKQFQPVYLTCSNRRYSTSHHCSQLQREINSFSHQVNDENVKKINEKW